MPLLNSIWSIGEEAWRVANLVLSPEMVWMSNGTDLIILDLTSFYAIATRLP